MHGTRLNPTPIDALQALKPDPVDARKVDARPPSIPAFYLQMNCQLLDASSPAYAAELFIHSIGRALDTTKPTGTKCFISIKYQA